MVSVMLKFSLFHMLICLQCPLSKLFKMVAFILSMCMMPDSTSQLVEDLFYYLVIWHDPTHPPTNPYIHP